MKKVSEIYSLLLKSFGPQGWWPVRGGYFNKLQSDQDRFEVCIGAILTQNNEFSYCFRFLDIITYMVL